MKGRGPVSPELRKLRGNPGRRKAPAEGEKSFFSGEAPEPDDGDEPAAPDPWSPAAWLPPGAREIWHREIEAAKRQARLQLSQLPLFATYCDALHRLERYTAVIEKDGATYTTPSGYRRLAPEVGLRDRAAQDVKALAAELMLSPKSWVSGMGTYAGRQLELFRDQPTPAPGAAPTPQAPHDTDSVDSYRAHRPTLQ